FAEMNASPHTHAGMARPAWKNAALVVVVRLRAKPTPRTNAKYTSITTQSSQVRFMSTRQSSVIGRQSAVSNRDSRKPRHQDANQIRNNPQRSAIGNPQERGKSDDHSSHRIGCRMNKLRTTSSTSDSALNVFQRPTYSGLLSARPPKSSAGWRIGHSS